MNRLTDNLKCFAWYVSVAVGATTFAVGWITVMIVFFESMISICLAAILLWCGYRLIGLGMENLEGVRRADQPAAPTSSRAKARSSI